MTLVKEFTYPSEEVYTLMSRFSKLGVVLALFGVGFLVAGGFAFIMVQDGYKALDTYSAAQDVRLSYDDNGELTDRGTVEGAEAIMSLLTEDWGYNVIESDFDPNDPVVNTASEYMFQMATISFHVLHGTQTVVLPEDVEYEGQVFTAGTYEFPVDGRYWTQFDRQHPIEGAARNQAWSGTALGLIGTLGVGTITHSTLQLALGLSAVIAGLGATFLVLGFGLMWASKEEKPLAGLRAPESSLSEPAKV